LGRCLSGSGAASLFPRGPVQWGLEPGLLDCSRGFPERQFLRLRFHSMLRGGSFGITGYWGSLANMRAVARVMVVVILETGLERNESVREGDN